MTHYFLHLGRRLLRYNCFILLQSDLYNNRFLFSCETSKTLAISYFFFFFFFAHLWMAELQLPTLVSSPTHTSICQGTWTSPALPRRRHSDHSRGSQPFWWNRVIRCSLGPFPAQDSLPPADVVSSSADTMMAGYLNNHVSCPRQRRVEYKGNTAVEGRKQKFKPWYLPKVNGL